MKLRFGFLVAMAVEMAWQPRAAEAKPDIAAMKAADLFTISNVWNLSLQLTPDQWEALEPKGGPAGFPMAQPGLPSAGPGANAGNTQRGVGAGPAGGGASFFTSLFLTPIFMKEGDANRDGKLSKEEFGTLAEKWFDRWDTNKSGVLAFPKLAAGLNSLLAAQNPFASPAGAPGTAGGGAIFSLQGAEGERNGLASKLGIEFSYAHTDLEFEGVSFKNAGLRYKGNGTFLESRESLKRPLKIDLNKNTKGEKLAGVTKLNLHNNVTDAGFMNEVLSYRLYRDEGVPSPRTAYARVYVTVPGRYDHQYLGLYSLVEEIDKNFTKARFGAAEGTLFKPSTGSPFSYLGERWELYKQAYDSKGDAPESATRRIIDFSRFVTQASDAGFAEGVAQYIDLDEFARFMAVTVGLSALDSILGPGQNYYLHLDSKGEKFQFLPWDEDHSFGQIFGSQEQRENLSIRKPWQGENKFLERMFQVPAFNQLYLTRLKEFTRDFFTPERLAKQVDELAVAIRPAVKEESAQKLAAFEASVAGRSPAAATFTLGPPAQGGKPIKAFMPARSRSLLDQLAGRSAGELVSGGLGGGGAGNQAGAQNTGFGQMLGLLFIGALDADKNGLLSRDEFKRGFDQWFDSWRGDGGGPLTADRVSAGLGTALGSVLGNARGTGAAPANP